ncbi:helix-turn-helix transcriptional regulator [Actinomadura soli]|uniref:helix-turn-helix transcriptional regulator n=1 Tax=Actinomadura soli TaxID=2508997 RepID=UPI001E4703E9|nr:LuxR C-terminal-related transcriptional regulator [Actinomadura soli]
MTELALVRGTGNLPAEVSRFVGRRRELVDVKRALERSRIVTLCGVGGVGKTRLAVRVADEARDAFPDGVWLVELSGLREPGLLARNVADALRLPDHASGDPADRLAEQLADQRMLLVLDTCEHVVDSCAMLAEVLLRAAPGLRILATSREPLELMGEHIVLVAPMESPGEDAPITGCESVTLFLERAEAMAPGFRLTEANQQVVATLCRRLEGIPLAIELAVVRLRHLSIEQLATRLDDRFRLLGTTRPGRGRHHTLRSAVEWSHELCTEPERLLWARLAAFPATFDLAEAEQVCADAELPADEVVTVLGRLVEKSIVICEQDGVRYRMLDTIREYGFERLADSDVRLRLAGRHRDHYLALAERAASEMLSPRQLDWVTRLRTENANLRVALGHALSAPGEEVLARRLVIALQPYWLATGSFGEGLSWHRRALNLSLEPDLDHGRVLTGAGLMAGLLGEVDVARPMSTSLSSLAEKLDDPGLAGQALEVRAVVEGQAGDLRAAVASSMDSRQRFAEADRPDLFSLFGYAVWAWALCFDGRAEEALALAEDGLSESQACGEQFVRSYLLSVRGQARRMSGDPAGGLDDLSECLRIKERLNDLFGFAMALDVVTACLADLGENERAAVLLGGRARRWRGHHAPGGARVFTRNFVKLIHARLQEEVPEAALQSAMRRGAAMSLTETIAFARGEPADPGTPQPEPPAKRLDALTPREQEVAALLADGLTNREIAERLVISKRTVDSHIEHILTKLSFTSRTQIAVWISSPPTPPT